MKFSKFAVLAILSFIAITLTACSGGLFNIVNPPPVKAATYSNASVQGTYSVLLSENNSYGIGSFIADGAGNITSGSFTVYAKDNNWYSFSCAISGTYSIKSSASGSATVTLSGSSCTEAGGSVAFNLQAAQTGETLFFAESDNGNGVTGTAVKQ